MLKQSMSVLEYEMMYSVAVTSYSIHEIVSDVLDEKSTITDITSVKSQDTQKVHMMTNHIICLPPATQWNDTYNILYR